MSPPLNSIKDKVTEWARKGASLILRIPSAIIPDKYNLVANPKHADFKKIKVGQPQPFALDDLWTAPKFCVGKILQIRLKF